jgi:hypothetical protein
MRPACDAPVAVVAVHRGAVAADPGATWVRRMLWWLRTVVDRVALDGDLGKTPDMIVKPEVRA